MADEKNEPLPTLRRALRAVRVEAYKAGLVYAIVDAAVTATVVALILSTVEVGVVPETVAFAVPTWTIELLEPLTGSGRGPLLVSGNGLVAAGAAALGFTVEVLYVSRRDTVRWFESANPSLGAALRTARETAGEEATDVMASELYRDVLDRLQTSSGVALLGRTGLVARLVVAMLAVLGAGGTVAVGLSFDLPTIGDADRPDRNPDGPPPRDGDPDEGEDGGLAPGESVLGDPTDVPRGTVPDDVVVDPGGGTGALDRPYETGGFPSGGVAVEAEAAGFAPPAVLEDAELVRAYSIAIRTNATAGGEGSG